MATSTEYRSLAAALRELHRTLVERARRDYERERFVALSPGELLQLLTADAAFEWLRPLSELMVDIDAIEDLSPSSMAEMAVPVRGAVSRFISAPAEAQVAGAFAQRYWPYVHDDPHVAMAHAGVKKALQSWPAAGAADDGEWLHHRHLIAEAMRQRRR